MQEFERSTKSLIKQEMTNKMDERRKWKHVNNKERRKNNRRLRKEMKRATEKAKKKYLESICDEIAEFQKTRRITQIQGEKKYPTYNKKKKANCIGQILHRNCLVKHVIKGKAEKRIEMMGRQGRKDTVN